MYARTTTIRGDRNIIDDLVTYVRDDVMPAITRMDGCIGLSLLTDHGTGRCVATSAWQSEEAMHASVENVRPMRQRFADMLGGVFEEISPANHFVVTQHPAAMGLMITRLARRAGLLGPGD